MQNAASGSISDNFCCVCRANEGNCILVVVSGVYYGAVSTAASLHLSLNAAFNFTRATGCTLRIELLRPAACGRSVRWRRRRQKKDRTEWQVPFTRQKSDPRGARRTAAERQVLTLKPTPRRRPPPARLRCQRACTLSSTTARAHAQPKHMRAHAHHPAHGRGLRGLETRDFGKQPTPESPPPPRAASALPDSMASKQTARKIHHKPTVYRSSRCLSFGGVRYVKSEIKLEIKSNPHRTPRT